MNNKLKSQKGITLIALVITIIVLLILAGVTIAMLTGENGILTNATNSKTKTTHSNVLEKIQLEASAYTVDKATGQYSKSIIDFLKSKNLISDISGEQDRWLINVTTLLGSNQFIGNGTYPNDVYLLEKQGTSTYIVKYNDEATGKYIQLGNLTDFIKSSMEDSNGLTVGKAYDTNLIKIGDPFTYTGDNQTEWIVFGKDENGDVLLTTATPVETDYFYVEGKAQNWLSYENDLHTHCAKYGNTNKGILGRSIKIEDINRVTGYTEPTLKRYTFGTELDYSNYKIDYYYPTTETATSTTNPYWKKATNASDSKIFTEEEIHPSYSYNIFTDPTVKNMEYVVGIKNEGVYSGTYPDTTEEYFDYAVASRSMEIVNYGTDIPSMTGKWMQFRISQVSNGWVETDYPYIACSNSDRGTDGIYDYCSLRPVVVLPANIKVEEGNDGLYKLLD